MKKWILGIGLVLLGILVAAFSLWSEKYGGYGMGSLAYRLADTLFWLGLILVVIGLMICFSRGKGEK